MSLALLFPGQGLQHAGMLPWLDEQAACTRLLTQLAGLVGPDWRRRLAEPGWSERNAVAQLLITATGLAAWQVLRAHGLPDASACAGYSVGEIAAFSAAGVFDASAALPLAAARAAAMDRAAAGRAGGLLAVSGEVAARSDTWLGGDVELAIRIAPDRCILGGPVVTLQRTAERLSALGADTSLLRIGVASHTSQMRAAALDFARHLDEPAHDATWRPPRCTLVLNLDGAAQRGLPALRQGLSGQIASTVQWQQCLQTLVERRPRCVLELGGGTALSRMWLAACPEVPARSADEFADPASVLDWVRGCLRG